jgi:hypothetical protein
MTRRIKLRLISRVRSDRARRSHAEVCRMLDEIDVETVLVYVPGGRAEPKPLHDVRVGDTYRFRGVWFRRSEHDDIQLEGPEDD